MSCHRFRGRSTFGLGIAAGCTFRNVDSLGNSSVKCSKSLAFGKDSCSHEIPADIEGSMAKTLMPLQPFFVPFIEIDVVFADFGKAVQHGCVAIQGTNGCRGFGGGATVVNDDGCIIGGYFHWW